jgi:uncharacterized protein (DUF1015 family)
MAEIAPLHALRFALTMTDGSEPGRVLAPPYDVISPDDRAALERQHPHNVVRLDLPRGEGDDKYGQARVLLDQWIAEGVLREDPRPALYRYEQTFTYAGRSHVRKGFVALLRLTPFSDRVVLPHEHTLSGPKVDRQKLMLATSAHFSQVFTLYRDPKAEVDAAFASAEAERPAVDTVTTDHAQEGVRHRLWVVTDPRTIARVTALLAPKQVMIADGHHRYETMVGLREQLRPAGAAPGASLADWGPIFFARAEDPGLLVLPTHRLIKNLAAEPLASLRERARPWFDVSEGTETTVAAIEARLRHEGETRVTLALRQPGRAGTTWFGVRSDADLSSLGPPALRGLDVSVLHGLLLGPLLGIDAAAMAKGVHLGYTHDTAEALAAVSAGTDAGVQGAFFMNPTQVEQVLAACEAGFVLPQKSTYFQPKLATGLVMARIDPQRAPARP